MKRHIFNEGIDRGITILLMIALGYGIQDSFNLHHGFVIPIIIILMCLHDVVVSLYDIMTVDVCKCEYNHVPLGKHNTNTYIKVEGDFIELFIYDTKCKHCSNPISVVTYSDDLYKEAIDSKAGNKK